MRPIASEEVCLSAAEIAERFSGVSGVLLHPTNVGNAAKKLDLDYIEMETEDSLEQSWMKKQRRYSEVDLPLIYKELQGLVNRRAKYEK